MIEREAAELLAKIRSLAGFAPTEYRGCRDGGYVFDLVRIWLRGIKGSGRPTQAEFRQFRERVESVFRSKLPGYKAVWKDDAPALLWMRPLRAARPAVTLEFGRKSEVRGGRAG